MLAKVETLGVLCVGKSDTTHIGRTSLRRCVCVSAIEIEISGYGKESTAEETTVRRGNLVCRAIANSPILRYWSRGAHGWPW